MEDVGRVGEEVRPEVLRQLRAREVRHVRGQLGLRVAPREVRVGLAEAGLREQRHHRRARERLGQEHRLGVRAPAPRAISHSQNGDRLGVRVVHAEHRHALADPVQHDVAQRAPERAPVLGVEVDVVDVLVALGRVLGVLERAVGPAVEPVGMLAQPGMVGRALDREVERDRDAELGRAGSQARELRRAAEVGMQRRVPAGLARRSPTGCPGRSAARSARCCGPCDASRPIGWTGGR